MVNKSVGKSSDYYIVGHPHLVVRPEISVKVFVCLKMKPSLYVSGRLYKILSQRFCEYIPYHTPYKVFTEGQHREL